MVRLVVNAFTLAMTISASTLLFDSQTQADDTGIDFFERKIRPVLFERCYGCHSMAAHETKKLQGELYLDFAAGIVTGGESGPAIVKGKSADSLLMRALKHDGLEMPPDGKLSNEVIDDFAKWIDMGAPDPRDGQIPVKARREINIEQGQNWWSFLPLETGEQGTGSQSAASQDKGGLAAIIDMHVRKAQTDHGLMPNVPASKEKLIRRAYFDLVGLPPTPQQVSGFLQDDAPNAFERVIDDLLASPRYGERWARHWLDAARFAESGGYEFDGFRPGAYHYRDWVIRALNADLPYDQFVRMQLAGDLLQPDDIHAASATGFLVAGPYPGQITAKTVEGIRYDQIDDMLMTVGGSMLGLTLGCARCHEHKYDPIPHQDYYALAASLARTVHGTRTIDTDPSATQAAIEKHQAELEPLAANLSAFASDQLPERFETWRASELSKQPEATRWQVLEPISLEAERSYLKRLPMDLIANDGLINPGTTVAGTRVRAARAGRGRGRKVGDQEHYRLAFETHQKNISSLRIDAFADSSLPNRGPGLNGDGSFQLIEIKVTAHPINTSSADDSAAEKPVEVTLKPIFAAFEDKDQPLSHAVDGKPETAWIVRATAKKDNACIFEFEKPLTGFNGGTRLEIVLHFRDLGIGRMRISISTEPPPATWAGDFAPQHLNEIRAILASNDKKLPQALRESMMRWFAPFDPEASALVSAVREHTASIPRPKLSEVYTTIPGGEDVYYLRRGEVQNKQGKATPGFLQVLVRKQNPNLLPAIEGAESQPVTIDPRLALANWITDLQEGAGPLLARVMANRIWHHHFGEGLVGTPNDFGFQGDRPTHPELLEALAQHLVANNWKLKPLHKQIMLSETYQQSHLVYPENLKKDPVNRYLWHFRPRRLEAEMIRDALLAVGSNLDLNMFGPSVLDNTQRRSIYLRVKRSELLSQMTMFDAPEPTQSIGERVATTVPTQALAMMNSPLVRQQAEKLLARIRSNQEFSIEETIRQGYQIALARPPTEHELAAMLAFVQLNAKEVNGKEAEIAASSDPAASDKALAEFCHVLLCLSEFIYVD